ncbi:MAG: transporter substrate-binding domain-containing protein [Anaerolineae bacterium]
MNRKRLALSAVVLCAALSLFWLLNTRSDDTLAEIRRRGALRVGLDASFPPFESLDERGQVVGLDADLARAFAADLGVEVEFVNIGFDGLYDALLARRVDVVISGLPVDPRWTQDVAYSRNYFNAGQALLVTSERGETGPEIQTVEALAGRIIAVEWGSLADMEARQLGKRVEGLQISPQPTAQEALLALRRGQAEAAIVDNVTAQAALSASGELRRLTMLTDEWYAAAVRLKSQDLLAEINRTLARLQESGELAEIEARWLGP